MEARISDTRLVGVEIECVVPIIGRGENIDVQSLLATVLTNAGMPAIARSYSRAPTPSGCKLVVEHDSSLRDESKYAGLSWSKLEIKTAPMVYRELERILPSALDVINYFGARVNPSCGLHVHHHLPEVADRPQVVKSLQHFWWRFHPVMFGLVAPSRKSSAYCVPPRPDEARQFDNCTTYTKLCGKLGRMHRYAGLNLTNLLMQDRMTVEWRLHSASTDARKILNWVLATQRWVEHAVTRNCHYKPEPVPNTRAGLNALLVSSGLKGNSRVYKVEMELRQVGKYLLRRWKQFNVPEALKSRRQTKAMVTAY